jgi:diacylglycerol kinase family enzyme
MIAAGHFRRVSVIVNPAAARGAPDDDALAAIFDGRGAVWTLAHTEHGGHAEELARAAADGGADVIAVYGGDSTVSDAARGLCGTGVPLAILPGGAANLLATNLGIPRRLRDAAALIFDPAATIRAVDMGQVGERLFFHLGIGLEGEMVRRSGRSLKQATGALAYYVSALGSLWRVPRARYRLTLDGDTVEITAINCAITTYGSLGVFGLSLSKAVDPGDGLLDVVVIERADLKRAAQAVASILTSRDLHLAVQHWQARAVTLDMDPPRPITLDSELVALDWIAAQVVPGAARIIAPGEF